MVLKLKDKKKKKGKYRSSHMRCSTCSSLPCKLPVCYIAVCSKKERETTGSPADNQEPWLWQPKWIPDMFGDISKAVGYHITLLLLDQPKDLGEMAVNTGITDSHGGGSSIKDQASPPWWLLPDGKGVLRILPKDWCHTPSASEQSGSLSAERLTLELIQYINSCRHGFQLVLCICF